MDALRDRGRVIGLPLINEAVIGIQDKDKYNATRPATDVPNFAALRATLGGMSELFLASQRVSPADKGEPPMPYPSPFRAHPGRP